MGIRAIIDPPKEAVEDSTEASFEAIAQQHEPPVEEASEPKDELVEQIPRVLPLEAVQLLRRLRLHEEQSTDSTGNWLKGLDQYEKVLQKRYQESLQQRRIDSYFIT